MMKTYLFPILAALSLSGVAFPQAEPPPSIEVDLRFYAWDSGPIYTNYDPEDASDQTESSNKTLYFTSGGESRSVELRDGRATRSIRYVGPPTLYLSKRPITVDTDPTTLQALQLRPNQNDLLLVAAPSSSTKTGLRFFPIDISRRDFPSGSLKVVNFSPDRVAARISVNNLALEPLQSTVIKVDEELGNGAPIKIAAPRNGQMRLVYTSTISVPPNERSALIIYPKGRAWRRIFLSDL